MGANSSEFEDLLNRLRQQLLDAQTHFDIWETLYYRTEAEAKALNAYRGFFMPTIDAHVTRFYIKISNVVDSGVEAPSFRRLFRSIKRDSTLAPGLDIATLRRRLGKHSGLLKKIAVFRNKRAAHWDTESEAKPAPREPTRDLLKDLQDIWNEVSKAHDRPDRRWEFRYLEHGHTQHLIDTLME